MKNLSPTLPRVKLLQFHLMFGKKELLIIRITSNLDFITVDCGHPDLQVCANYGGFIIQAVLTRQIWSHQHGNEPTRWCEMKYYFSCLQLIRCQNNGFFWTSTIDSIPKRNSINMKHEQSLYSGRKSAIFTFLR